MLPHTAVATLTPAVVAATDVCMTHTNAGERLRWLREQVEELSQREVDRIAGRTEGQCGMIEGRGQMSMRPDVAASYANVFGVTRSWLLFGEGSEPTADAVRAAVEAARAAKAPPADPADPSPYAKHPPAPDDGASPYAGKPVAA